MKKFDDREALAGNLAEAVAKKLSAAIEKDGDASLAVSGGSTPKMFFEKLSQAKLDWSKVTVTLVDDRMVALQRREQERLHCLLLSVYQQGEQVAKLLHRRRRVVART